VLAGRLLEAGDELRKDRVGTSSNTSIIPFRFRPARSSKEAADEK
jgi:hypothetical protein